jgi:tetratricopeptide (TPR) repeat protein
MRGCLGRVARAVACAVAIGCVGVGVSAPAVGQPKPQAQPQAQPQARPGEPAKPKPFDVCKGLTGANAPTKVEACTEAIKDGKLAPSDQALAYLNRGLSESGPGSEARSKDDYKAAIRIFNELILGSPMNPYYYTQRGVIYQTIGEADRAILDYSDAIRLAPRETYPLINRGVVLYLRKDNNEGAIADLTAALKIKPCEVSA